jgi:adenine/guanine phosphoribosyltransferase-like PRPP-binding protein
VFSGNALFWVATGFIMEPDARVVQKILNNLKEGFGISVKPHGDTKLLRIEWLNLYNMPEDLKAIAQLFSYWIFNLGYKPQAITSIETSGAKYGVATSLFAHLPYFSLHKVSKLIFEEPIAIESRSITEDRALKLFGDKSVIQKYKSVVLIDDIRRTSHTIDSAIELIERCGSDVEGVFVVLDFKFAKHPYPKKVDQRNFHALFEIENVKQTGECEVNKGLALSYLEKVSVL